MSVNGINTSSPAVDPRSYSAAPAKQVIKEEKVSSAPETAAVYEPSKEKADTVTKKTYTPNTELVNQLKLDQQTRMENLQSMVQKLISKQATAYGNATDIWSFLREGKFTVDPETKAQAQADIAEDGYWGVKQTSDRIVNFANALTGGDPDKLDSMIEAFKKGFRQAEKTWGGELPEISQKTYDAVLEKFEQQRQQYAQAATAMES